MAFYKRIDEQLVCAPNYVYTPTISLFAEQHATYTYPVDGWYWYDTLDDAMANMQTPKQNVTARQFKLALLQIGLYESVQSFINNTADVALKITYLESVEFVRTHPFITQVAAMLGKTDTEIDALFALAATL